MAEKKINVFPSENANAPLVVVNATGDEGEIIYNAIGDKASLAAVCNLDWNDDLSPWPSRPVFRKGEPFGGLADRYAAELSSTIIPGIEQEYGLQPAYIAIAGYSLAGMFALYSAYRTSMFSRIASVSGSLWYPGFADYAECHEMMRRPDRIYLSLGDREESTANQYMRTVRDCTERLYEKYRQEGIDSVLEMNPGNHFQDAEERMIKGIRWILR